MIDFNYFVILCVNHRFEKEKKCNFSPCIILVDEIIKKILTRRC